MIGYVCVGTNDWQRALSFYDALMTELGAKRVMNFDTFVAWHFKADHEVLAAG